MSPLFVFAAVVSLAAASPAAAQTFVFHLSGDQEVPPTPSVERGGCHGVLDQPAATFSMVCSHDVVGATMIHVHQGAAGVNGPVLFDLGDPASPVSATWTGMTAAEIADLLAGELYLNIHTAGRPDGMIRGQIVPRSFDSVAFGLDGAQVVPPNGTAAGGSCSADLNDPATAIDVLCTHDVAAPAAAHVHHAPRGQNGPSIFDFPSPASPLSATVPLAPVEVAHFVAGFLYLDVHGEVPPGDEAAFDEIRGQIAEAPATTTTGTIHVHKRTFPSGGTGFGFTDDVPGSPGSFTLDDGQTETFLAVPAGTYAIAEDDPGVTPGGFGLAHVECSDGDSVGDRFARTATIRLAAGEVVSCTFENQALPSGGTPFVFHLSPDQEAPPLSGPERGGCMASFDGVDELTLVCVHDVVGPTIMHVHRGAPGVNGEVAFDLGDPTSPVLATWSGMTTEDVADLLAGDLYVNIHTSGRPEGAIRGQIVSDTFGSLAFGLDGAQAVPPNGTAATGSCTADLDDAATAVDVSCTHDLADPVSAHVHQAPRGQNGPSLFDFASPASPSATVPLAPIDVANLVAGFLYVDVHGGGMRGDETVADDIRGQIAEAPAAPTTGTIHVRKRTFPAGGTGFGFTDDVPGSAGVFTLDDGDTRTFLAVPAGTYTIAEDDPGAAPGGHVLTHVECSDGDSVGDRFARTATVQLAAGETVTCTFENQALAVGRSFAFHLSPDQEAPPLAGSERGGCMASFDGVDELTLVCTHDVVGPTIMHVHRGAPGVNGPVAFDLGDPSSPVLATWSGMTPQDVADLLAGDLYVNIHTSGRPGGAIRGQIVPRSIPRWEFPLSGDQQVPPVPTAASGSCTAALDAAATELTVHCVHDVSAPTMAHVHQAPAGANGPIRFVLDDPGSPFTLVTAMSPRDVADLMAGFFYVNVHSEANPDGEIRGQIVDLAASAAVDVPALGTWGVLLLAAALAALALRRLGA
ncbi:MAG TPA: CHRD domain-containing protein [Thermoanaerobaculia bacterium]|nr:CHRD domain-containing protein [Thermoanaerobaculia bacterium]